MRIFAALLFAVTIPAAAQKVEVPHKLEFAGMTLVIHDDARREIQKDVDALTASPRHYNIKAERARMYFPIIEKVFREEGLPEDFKYLVLQESALIPDAVSSSNAVGFWQFKDFTAIEMGLRVDREIDERLNIAASSRAAARYLKKNFEHFDNWIFALQAYQMGAGGVMRSVEDTRPGAKRMDITGKTYWYVKKFLAHKIAYEGGVKGTPQNQVVVFESRSHNTLKRLAHETKVDEEALVELNKWAKKGVIPDDRTYVVLLPVPASTSSIVLADAKAAGPVDNPPARVIPAAASMVRGKINGVHTVQALPGDDVRRLAARAGVDVPKFLKWNDLKKGDAIVAGQVYFLGKKRLKGSEDFHKLSSGESLWEISQKYGLQLKRLRHYNRIDGQKDPTPGTMLFLSSRRPQESAVIAKVEDAVEVDNQQTFSWAVTTENSSAEPVKAVPANIGQSEIVLIPDDAVKAVDSVKILQTNKSAVSLEDKPQEVQPTRPIPESKQHIVQAGETLYAIARIYNLGVMQLVEWNNLSLQDGIKAGQVLQLTDGSVPVARASGEERPLEAQILHEVKTSDTLYSIARQYNVTIKQIMEWNEKKDFSLSVGEKLRIMSGQ